MLQYHSCVLENVRQANIGMVVLVLIACMDALNAHKLLNVMHVGLDFILIHN